eukprot:TRINITY_DN917_c0_g1_i9.p1 TRINITY_DN917_c0_g1~~TRINITY_DN917_c0_g1_i9.p1  ORF type:complete len:588 (-),score=106.49 TRINITY_DN917_c0_g1_i9:44-1807(-)
MCIRDRYQRRVHGVEEKINENTSSFALPKGLGEEAKTQDQQSSKTQKQKVKLQVEHFLGEINVAGKEEQEVYDKGIQVEFYDGQNAPMSEITPPRPRGKLIGEQGQEESDALPAVSNSRRVSKIDQNALASYSLLLPGLDLNKAKVVPQEPPQQTQKLTVDECKTIMKTKNYADFMIKSTKLVEKALDQPIDNLNSTISEEEDDQDSDADDQSDLVYPIIKFFDKNNSTNRVITDLKWSNRIHELLLAAYSQKEEGNINDPVGVVLLWSLSLKSRPEYHLYCQSPVVSANFDPFSNHTVVGGLYSGQVVLWDLRAKQVPVIRASGHTHPVFSLNVVGTQNSHNLVSVSNDGKLCVWNLSMMNAPTKTVELKIKPKQQVQQQMTQDINCTSICFPQGDTNNFYAGTEDGVIYLCQIHPQSKNDNIIEMYEGHEGPITSLSLHSQLDNAKNLTGLLVSSSFDWTSRLWNPRVSTKSMITMEAAEDYIYDAQWHPTLPATYMSVDGEGYLDIWNLLQDTEVPVMHYKTGINALNKAQWNHDGSKMVIGDSHGSVNVLGFHKNKVGINQEMVDSFDLFVNTPKGQDKFEGL